MPLDLRKIRQWVASCDSVADAARRVGMQPSNLFAMLSDGRDDIRLSRLERFADAMGVEPTELIRRAKIA